MTCTLNLFKEVAYDVKNAKFFTIVDIESGIEETVMIVTSKNGVPLPQYQVVDPK